MDQPLFDRLLPAGKPATAVDLLAAEPPWERVQGDRPLVLVNMVATADGRITIDGRAGPIGGAGDHSMFHGLRTVVDAVLVGIGTLRVERYGRLVRLEERRARRAALGLAPDPVAVVISRTGTLPWDAPMFEAPEQRVLVVVPPHAPPFPEDLAARVERVELAAPTPAAALRVLRSGFGIRSVLCEGGPTLNRGLLADGVVDELYLTVAPLLGGGDDALRILAGDELPEPLRMELAWVLHHGGEVFLRYRL